MGPFPKETGTKALRWKVGLERKAEKHMGAWLEHLVLTLWVTGRWGCCGQEKDQLENL